MNPIDRKTFLKICWCALGLLLFGGAHAQEGNCPPGYQPIGAEPGQDGPQGCAPTPGEEQQQPPVRWADRWGAIATYEPGGIIGSAINMPSQKEAEQAAMTDCQTKGGGAKCKFQISYRNECVALMVGNKAFNITPGTTLNEATQSGMKICTANDNSNCHVYYSACSPPVRIQ